MAQPSLGNGITAFPAMAEFALFDPVKRCCYGKALCLAPPFLRQRHGLNLHGINPRKAPDTVLIKRHRRPPVGRETIFIVELQKTVEKHGAVYGGIGWHPTAPSAPEP